MFHYVVKDHSAFLFLGQQYELFLLALECEGSVVFEIL